MILANLKIKKEIRTIEGNIFIVINNYRKLHEPSEKDQQNMLVTLNQFVKTLSLLRQYLETINKENTRFIKQSNELIKELNMFYTEEISTLSAKRTNTLLKNVLNKSFYNNHLNTSLSNVRCTCSLLCP